MRRVLILAAIVLAAVTAAEAITPFGCTDTCDVEANEVGYIDPVVEVISGASLTWTSSDITHIQVERSSSESCFFTIAEADTPSDPAQFVLEDGTVKAVQYDEDTSSYVTKECQGALVADDSLSAVLPYLCALHPTMNGGIVVSAF